jgi:translation elongation factor EF-Ts
MPSKKLKNLDLLEFKVIDKILLDQLKKKDLNEKPEKIRRKILKGRIKKELKKILKVYERD